MENPDTRTDDQQRTSLAGNTPHVSGVDSVTTLQPASTLWQRSNKTRDLLLKQLFCFTATATEAISPLHPHCQPTNRTSPTGRSCFTGVSTTHVNRTTTQRNHTESHSCMGASSVQSQTYRGTQHSDTPHWHMQRKLKGGQVGGSNGWKGTQARCWTQGYCSNRTLGSGACCAEAKRGALSHTTNYQRHNTPQLSRQSLQHAQSTTPLMPVAENSHGSLWQLRFYSVQDMLWMCLGA